MITGAEGQIVVIDEGKEEAKPEEVVVANLNKVRVVKKYLINHLIFARSLNWSMSL